VIKVTLLISLVGLILFTIFMNEILKKASRLVVAGGRSIYCKVCGRSMMQTPINWSYRLPFEMWAVVAKYDLKLNAVSRYVCPDKHTQAWFLPSGGDRCCDVLVSKEYPKG
jgi:hypothetical protein